MFLKNLLSASVLVALPFAASALASNKPFAYEKKVNHVIAMDAEFATNRYFVQLRDLPTAFLADQYRTKKAKLNMQAAPVKARKQSIEQKQASFTTDLSSMLGRIPKIHHRYQTAFNGISVDLTEQEAEKLLELPQVLKVIRQVEYKLNTDVSPEQLGAETVWQGVNGTTMPAKGEGVIMGIIDSGVNTDHPSFAAQGDDGYVHTNPIGHYIGDCTEDATLCNDKLIGVFHYESVTVNYGGVRPENGVDYNGHGSHVASTAAGNILRDLPYYNVGNEAVSDGIPVAGTNISQMAGMAPHANIVSFQVCLPTGGCAPDAMLQAVEDAIENGIDVINMSIGPNGEGPHPWSDALDMAFLAAHEAGTFIALSAGNSGSGSSTIGHLAPWTTIVANASHGRYFEKSLSASTDNTTQFDDIVGRGNMSAALSGEVVYAGDVDPSRNRCDFYAFQSFPELEGKVVLCDRGTFALMDMAQNVRAHGATGIIIRNTDGSSTQLHSLPFSIPGIMIDQSSGNALKTWIDNEETPTVTLSAGDKRVDLNAANVVNVSSSRGPNSLYPDLMVPHISAPGTDIYAAYTDEQPFHANPAPSDYTFLTGTSMASPHIAGIAALITQLHPEWTPSEIQSAMMLTANTEMKKEDGTTAADLWDMGAGMVRADLAVESGLIMNVTKNEFLAADPATGADTTTLNMPLLVDANCEGSCSWTRTFTATKDADWTLSLAKNNYSLSSMSITPNVIAAKAGESYEVTFSATIAESAADDWISSSIELTSSEQTLAMPMHIRPLVAVAPSQLTEDYYYLQGKMDLNGFKFRRPEGIFFQNSPLIKADSYQLILTNDSDINTPFDDLTDGVAYFLMDIEAGSSPIDIYIGEASNQDTDLFIGLDSNGDGIPQLIERICVSATDKNVGEHCQLSGGLSGTYWVMAWNYENQDADSASVTIDVVKATDENSVAMNVTKQSGSFAFDELAMSAIWDGALETNASYYSAITTYMRNELTGDYSKFAETNFKVNQLGAPASVSLDSDSISVGQETDMQFEFAPNLLAQDVNYTITLNLADGFMVTGDSLDGFAPKTSTISHTLTVPANTASPTTLTVPVTLVEKLTGEFKHTVTMSTDFGNWQTSQSFTQVNSNEAPQVSIDASVDASDAGQTVTLTANVTDDSDTEVTYLWRQVAGVSAMAGVQQGQSITVTMPRVEVDSVLEFEVLVSDGELTHSATKTITVNKENEVIVEDDTEDSGSLYYLLLLAIPAMFRRRK
ncbi:S8 family serine peptidase [Pseudoalteromonas prydzensis]|uniref:S8 family serine peptidase n=1 Tax=Pseudoalteromonas prydzensis TaxID=182141 RepID=UPI0007E4E433|nr:S8 family serine peptidase [Pseudoalteromonas prydzensis]MBE0380256.1 hypothetical protein [Pseudoalteromonas prydzensis ACAM 620]